MGETAKLYRQTSARARVDSVGGDGGIVGVACGGARQGVGWADVAITWDDSHQIMLLSQLQFMPNILRKHFIMT